MTEPVHAPGPTRLNRHRLTTSTAERPRCPACGGMRLQPYRTDFHPCDARARWWVRCRTRDCCRREGGVRSGAVDVVGRRDVRFGDLQGAAADLGDMAKRGARRDQEQAGQKQGMARDGGW